MGASNLRIILKHILPQTTSYVIIAMTLSVPSYILAESGLSFLGFDKKVLRKINFILINFHFIFHFIHPFYITHKYYL